jgi:hypothetical protein
MCSAIQFTPNYTPLSDLNILQVKFNLQTHFTRPSFPGIYFIFNPSATGNVNKDNF